MMVKNLLVIVCFSLLLGACQEDGNELDFNDLRGDEIIPSEEFKFSAVLDVFPFQTDLVSSRTTSDFFEMTARKGQQEMKITIPVVEKGRFLGSSGNFVTMTFKDVDNRIYSSDSSQFTSDLLVTVSSIDSTQNKFDGSFSATLYYINSQNPARQEDQLIISEGSFTKVKY